MNCNRNDCDDPRLTQPAFSLNAWADLVLNFRKRRATIFGADLFNDPAWDIILLLVREMNAPGLPLQEISAQIERSEESTRRWLNILIEHGHVEAREQRIYRLASLARKGLSQIAIAGSIQNA